MPVQVDIPFTDLSWENLIDSLNICVWTGKEKLRRNMVYFDRYEATMSPKRRKVNGDRIKDDILRLNLMDELLTRLQVFDLLAIQRSIDLAVKTEMDRLKPLPDKYQLIITVNEQERTINTQYIPIP